MQNKTNQGQKVVSPVLDRVISEMSNFLSKQGWGGVWMPWQVAQLYLDFPWVPTPPPPPWGWVQHLTLYEVNAAPITHYQHGSDLFSAPLRG